MRYQELIENNTLEERRRNPEQNEKEPIIDTLLRYADDPDIFIHTSNVEKVGINPRTAKSTSDDTPAGIFTFHLNTYKKKLLNAKENDLRVSWVLPYIGGNNLFILRSKEPYQDTLQSYTKSDLDNDVDTLKTIYDSELVDNSLKIASTNENYVNAPIGDLWGMTKAIAIGGTSELSHQQYPDPMKWNKMLRQLGFGALHDKGYGWLHGAEASQSLFLTSSAFDVVDKLELNRKQEVFKIGGNEYAGGRIPKHLVLSRLDDTEMTNLDYSKVLDKVQTVTVNRASMRDISELSKLKRLFKRAKITVDEFLADSKMFERWTARMENAFKNFSINKLVFNGEMPSIPMDINKLETIVPNVQHIMYTPSTTMMYGRPLDLEKFPDAIRTKMKPYA